MDYRRPAVFRILCASRTIYTARSFSTQEPNMNTLSLGQQIFADLSAGNLEAVLQRCADDSLTYYREDSTALQQAMEA
jgi:hypothetical protein